MLRFLVDANISPLTVNFLIKQDFEVRRISSSLSDERIFLKALTENRIILTLDLDFGEIYYFSSRRKTGVWIIRTKNQTIENINRILNNFLSKGIYKQRDLSHSLVILTEKRYRIIEI